MHAPETMEQWLLVAAESADRKLDASRIRRLGESYRVLRGAGLTDVEIKDVLAITDHEMQQVLRLQA